MPIYEYNCKSCQKKFELLVRNPREEIKCPFCGSSDIDKLFSLFATTSGPSSSSCSSCTAKKCSTCG